MARFLNLKYILITIIILLILVTAIKPNICKSLYTKSASSIDDDINPQKKNWAELIKKAQIQI